MEGLPGHPVRGQGRSRRRTVLLRRIVVLRHGRTAHNADGRIQGQLDVPLDEVGFAQAEALGTIFASDPPALVVSSDLLRAQATAQAVCDHLGLPLNLDERLRETYFGLWQGKTADEVREAWPTEYAAWRGWTGHPVNGETGLEVAARASAAVHEWLLLVPPSGTLLVVAHGGTARALLGTFTELPFDSWHRLAALGNTCWSILYENPRGWQLERHNTGLGPLLGPPTGSR